MVSRLGLGLDMMVWYGTCEKGIKGFLWETM